MNFFRPRLLMVLATAVVVLITTLGRATSFAPQTLQDRVKDAPSIVRGVVGGSHSDWSEGRDGTRRIYTFYEFSVREVLKQGSQELAAAQSLVVRELGGIKDGIGMEVSGAAQFKQGEDVVLMLGARNPDASYDMRGMMMGKFNVERDSEGREVLQGPGLSLAGGDHGPEHASEEGGQAGTPSAPLWTLEAVRKLIHNLPQGIPQDDSSTRAGNSTGAPNSPSSPVVTGPQGGAPALQPNPEGSAGDWGLGVALALGLLGLWMVIRSRK